MGGLTQRVRPGRVLARAGFVIVVAALVGGPLASAPVLAASPGSDAVRTGEASASLSLPLRDLQPDTTVPAAHGAPLDMLADLPTHPGQPLPHVTDTVVQTTQSASSTVSTAQNFEGVGNIDGVYPPDTNGAVGPNHYVQWVNLHFAVYSKAGALLYGPKAGNTLWSGTNTPCATQNAGDPIVLYDRRADRWLFGQFTSSSPYGECIAISQTGDPTGAYYRYFFQFSTSVFYDYPKIGIWSNGYFLTANRFGSVFYQGASAIAIDRSAMLAGQTVRWVEYQTSSSYGTLLPADIDGSTMPPAGAGEPIADIRSSGYLDIRRLTVDWAASTWSLSAPTSLVVPAYNQLCPGTRSCVPQPGTSVGLDGLGDRLMYRLAYRNLGDHESLVVDHAVNVASSGVQAGIRWYEVRNVSTTPTLYQKGTFAPDGTSRWMGTMAIDASGGISLGYSVSSSSVYPGLRVTGRLSGDTLNQMTQGETTIIAGSGVQTGSAYRWGDYASMSIDPTDDCTFWFTSEYMPTTGPAPWHTRIASFKLPGCGTATATPSAPQNLTATPGNGQVSLTWAAPASTGTSAIASYSIYRGTTSGGEGTTPIATVTSGTTYSDTGVTNGTTYYYTVKATNSSGTGPASNEASATPATVPGAPQNLAASAGNGTVALTWAAPASNGGSGITSYSIYRGTTSGGEGGTPIATVAGTSYNDGGLTNGTTYYYIVKATNLVGTGAASNEASATPTAPAGATVPGAPQNLAAGAARGKGVQLTWGAPSSDGGSAITGYAVYRAATSGAETLLTTLGVVTSYKDTSTSRGTLYYYEVAAINSVGTGPFSNEASATAK